jgi:hypothetical protein
MGIIRCTLHPFAPNVHLFGAQNFALPCFTRLVASLESLVGSPDLSAKRLTVAISHMPDYPIKDVIGLGQF